MRRITALALAAAVLAAGCGIRPTGIVDAGGKPAADGRADAIALYLVDRSGKLAAVTRPGLPGLPDLPVTQLSVRPTERERARGLRTEVDVPLTARIVNGVLVVEPGSRRALRNWTLPALAQIACTGEAIPGVGEVKLRDAPPRGDDRGWGVLACSDYADLLAEPRVSSTSSR
ncbi:MULTISPECIES: hypothetical protein [Actinomadura]|uniref:hypothetical protein n=1 Tax=Actinomadura TaxID=1988 RepID=UPI000417B010|nr:MULTISPECIES: hypothetical protein [Actinomadura]RSN53971.1 hypothetical protein DMH08_27280 [Actinomadura sp. WAC 06369]